MTSFRYLTDKEFGVEQGKKGNILCTNISGISVVLFYSKECQHCLSVLPIFIKLASQIRSVQFAALNVTTYPRVPQMSNKTVAPITEVPFIVLFVNGRPFIKYIGKHTTQEIGTFVFEMAQRLQGSTNFAVPKTSEVIDNEIPAYALSKPYNVVCENDMCYINFQDL